MKHIYLDVCALCRPYDDQSYARINLETIAVHLILKTLEDGQYAMISSPAHKVEICSISDDLERIDLLLLLEKMAVQPNRGFEMTMIKNIKDKDLIEKGTKILFN